VSRPADPADLQALLGVQVDEALFQRALTHRSYAYEHGGLPTNERLEFLGDSVLGLVTSEFLYRRHPDEHEGQLTKTKSLLEYLGIGLSAGLLMNSNACSAEKFPRYASRRAFVSSP